MTTTAPFKPLTKEDIAEVLGISLRTVENWVNDGTLLSPKKIGTRVYWHPSAFYTWLDQCLADNATEAATPSAVQGRSEEAAKPVSRKRDTQDTKTELTQLRNRDSRKLESLLNSQQIA